MPMIHRTRRFMQAVKSSAPPAPAPLRHTQGQIATISTSSHYWGAVYVEGSTTAVPGQIAVPGGGSLKSGTMVELLISKDLIIVIGGYP